MHLWRFLGALSNKAPIIILNLIWVSCHAPRLSQLSQESPASTTISCSLTFSLFSSFPFNFQISTLNFPKNHQHYNMLHNHIFYFLFYLFFTLTFQFSTFAQIASTTDPVRITITVICWPLKLSLFSLSLNDFLAH